MRAVFERYDRDGNGRLDYRELRTALAAFGLDVSHDKSKDYLSKYDRDRSGYMEIDEFAKLVEELRRQGYELRDSELAALRAALGMAEHHMRISPEIRQVFERFDRNRSGKLDYRELREAMRALGLDLTTREATQVLQKYDRDRSGTLELDEFAQLVEHLRKLWYESTARELADLRAQLAEKNKYGWVSPEIRAAFERYDRNKSGKLDYSELHAALKECGCDPSQAKDLLNKYDANRNGVLELEEFARLVEAMRRRGIEMAAREATKYSWVAADIRAAFERYDRNKSGKLDYSELRSALKECGLDPSVEYAKELLNKYDANKNGLLELEEFAQLVEAMRRRGTDLAQSELARLRAEIARLKEHGVGKREVGSIQLRLNGRDLAALDRKIFSKNSSDPYYVLHCRDSTGGTRRLGRSETVQKNLNPQWSMLEVPVAELGNARQLRIEVWDHDIMSKDDLIGVAEVDLQQDLVAMLGKGGGANKNEYQFPTRQLTVPGGASGGRGTLEGSFALVEAARWSAADALELDNYRRKGGKGGKKELARLTFNLHGANLAALDRKLMSANSSDPYFVLQTRDGSGAYHQIGKSNTIKSNLNPKWNPLVVDAEQLGRVAGAKQLRLEVWDWDMAIKGGKDDLIGVAAIDLPDLEVLLGRGQQNIDLPQISLLDPNAKPQDSFKSRGTVSGNVTIEARQDANEELRRLREENSRLRAGGARLGAPEGQMVGSLSFSLRGHKLAALDKKLFSKDSSDPFYKLEVKDSGGKWVSIAKSKTIMKTLDPQWEPVEVAAEQLGGARELKVKLAQSPELRNPPLPNCRTSDYPTPNCPHHTSPRLASPFLRWWCGTTT